MSNNNISTCNIRAGTSVLALNSTDNRLIAAGQQNFQLYSIEKVDNIDQFTEIHDFRSTYIPSSISRWCALQPKDVAWNPHDVNCFAAASGTGGYLYLWDLNRSDITNQLNIHKAIINRVLFHPKYPYYLLTASQDGYAKLIDYRINNAVKVVTTFRHISKEGFRDIEINLSNTDKFAAVINDQYSVPIWDLRQPTQPDFSVLTRDKVLSIAWNPYEHSWLATGGIGGHDRTIRVWDAKGNDNRQEPLFTVYTFGQVTKLSWRPTNPYHIACFTRTTDPRIHVWDIRRPYLPQLSFCHHRNDIEDFLWRPNSDNIISVGRDERLIHANISSAIQTEHFESLFSLNLTSKGCVNITMPYIDNDYVHTLYREKHIPLTSSSLHRLYSHETISTFHKWDKIIRGRSILGIYSNNLRDKSVEIFHQFARKWIIGNGDKSFRELEYICDVNSMISDELNRPDLKATWQIIKMLYTRSYNLIDSTKNSRSILKSQQLSESRSGGGGYRYQHQKGRKKTSIEKLQQENRTNEQGIGDKLDKSQEQTMESNSKMGIMDDTDTYIVRDVLTDDLIFVTPDDLLQNGNGNDPTYENYLDIETLRDSIPLALGNLDGDEQFLNSYGEPIWIDDDNELESPKPYENSNGNMQTSTYSTIPDGSEKFFTIDESYCPTIQNNPLNFDDIIRQTLWYYVEHNELQVAVHLLLALYPQLNEQKRIELFNGAHLQWIVMYIELLQKLRLFVKAKQITKHCIEKESMPLYYNSSDYDGTIIFAAQAPTLKRLPFVASSPLSSTIPNNKNLPPILKEFMCSICRILCRGLFSFCGVCFHGGHIDHLQTWFKTHDQCPYGCGHRCIDHDNQIHRNSISQRFISKSSNVFQ